MTMIDQHLLCHTRLDAVSAVLAYIGAFFLLAFALASNSITLLAVLTPVAALVMLATSAVVLELVRVSPQAQG